MGYLGITFLTQGYPQGLPLTDALALYNQPGGSLMWVSFWVVAAGWGMGRYAGQVDRCLRARLRRSPPRSCAGTIRTRPSEQR